MRSIVFISPIMLAFAAFELVQAYRSRGLRMHIDSRILPDSNLFQLVPVVPISHPIQFDYHTVFQEFAVRSEGFSYDLLESHNSYITSTVLLAATSSNSIELGAILSKAADKALAGGTAGASAAAVQVVTLMWLRTALNYQYKYGTSTGEALTTLYNQGGIPRLYQGLPFAIIQGPLSRFGDTAANALLLSIIESLDPENFLPIFLRTALGSIAAGLFRILLLPVDAAKTCLQVDGAVGWTNLQRRVATDGPRTLFSGGIAASAATAVGHYPWFLTYNFLSEKLPTAKESLASWRAYAEAAAVSSHTAIATAVTTAAAAVDSSTLSQSLTAAATATASATSIPDGITITIPLVFLADIASGIDPAFVTLMRSAFIGLCASSLSDVCSNSLRVLKTARQTTESGASYTDLAKDIIDKEGILGLFGRGLQTRLLANALQGMMFSVLFKYFQSSSR